MLFDLNTNLIILLRRCAFLFGIVVIALVAAWPYLQLGNTGSTSLRVEQGTNDEGDELTLENAVINSKDSQSRPLEIVAETATPKDKTLKEVGLSTPEAKLDLGDGKSLQIKSNSGDYRQEDNQLVLKGDVKISNSEGYLLNSQSANLALDTNTVSTDTKVTGVGPGGTLEADGLIYEEDGKRIILKGKSKLVFNVKQIKADQEERAGEVTNVSN